MDYLLGMGGPDDLVVDTETTTTATTTAATTATAEPVAAEPATKEKKKKQKDSAKINAVPDDKKKELQPIFEGLGLSTKQVVDLLKNDVLSYRLKAMCDLAGTSSGADKQVGAQLLESATKLPEKVDDNNLKLISVAIAKKSLSVPSKLKAAIDIVSKSSTALSQAEFDKAAGVGVEITKADIEKKIVEMGQVAALSDWSKVQFGNLMNKLRDALPFGDPKLLKDCLDAALLAKLGARPAAQPKGKKAQQPAQQPKAAKEPAKPVELKDVEPGKYEKISIPNCADYDGQRVFIRGWVDQIREQSKKMWFVLVRDGLGYMQCIMNPGAHTTDSTLLRREASVHVYGILSKPPPSKFTESGYELHVDRLDVIGQTPAGDSAFENVVSADSSIDTKLDQKHLVLRGKYTSSLMKLRSYATQGMRNHFFKSKYFEVSPPTMVQTQAEGGSELFSFDFFGEKAYMTQSSQLYLETCLPSMGNVFCILNSYRAEESRTRRHLAEYCHVEAELPFISFDDLLNAIESLVVDTYQWMMDNCGDLLKEINPKAAVPKRPFKRLNYSEAVKYCNEHGILNPKTGKDFVFGEDIPEAPERKMVDMMGEPVFMCRFPVEMKAFYMMKCKEDPTLTESTDLLMPNVGEIVGGSMRIWNYEELMAAYKREGLDASPYYWYTDQRKYGSTPHGGYGLGLERFLMYLLNVDHIRELCLFPRYKDRCQP